MVEAWRSQRGCLGLPTCQEKALGTWQGAEPPCKGLWGLFPRTQIQKALGHTCAREERGRGGLTATCWHVPVTIPAQSLLEKAWAASSVQEGDRGRLSVSQ